MPFSYKFKATELNRKIFDCNGTLGVYMEPKKPRTEIEPFNFDTEQRAVVHKIKEQPLNEVCIVTVNTTLYCTTIEASCEANN